MSGIRLFNVHYVWEDILSMGLGALIMLTSWMVGDAGNQIVPANADSWHHRVSTRRGGILGFAPMGGGPRNRLWVVADRVAIRFRVRQR